MSTGQQPERIVLLQGALDLLILRTLLRGPVHCRARCYRLTAGSRKPFILEASRRDKLARATSCIFRPAD